jgi:homocysteine S-methyltransferase
MNDTPILSFPDLLATAPVILGEGAVIERLRRNPAIVLDPHVVNSALIYQPDSCKVLADICREYLDIGQQFDLPLLLSTPTWRANGERIAASGLSGHDLNGDNARFLAELRRGYGDYGRKVVICGLMSCKGDAYNSAEALDTNAAREFHRWQADALAASGVDFLLAATLPALSEATGLAQALAATGLPYVISVLVCPRGTLLDGTPLSAAIAAIDASSSTRPLAYLVNCTHASVFRQVLLQEINAVPLVRERVIGLLANTSPLSPEELDNSAELAEEDPTVFGSTVAALHKDFGMKLLGGCCGTDDRHIRCLAERLAGYRSGSINSIPSF